MAQEGVDERKCGAPAFVQKEGEAGAEVRGEEAEGWVGVLGIDREEAERRSRGCLCIARQREERVRDARYMVYYHRTAVYRANLTRTNIDFRAV